MWRNCEEEEIIVKRKCTIIINITLLVIVNYCGEGRRGSDWQWY